MSAIRFKKISYWSKSTLSSFTILLAISSTLPADPVNQKALVESADLQQGKTLNDSKNLNDSKKLYDDLCRDCHGRKGLTKALGKSRGISSMESAEIKQALLSFRVSTQTESRGIRAKLGLSDTEIEDLASYVPLLDTP